MPPKKTKLTAKSAKGAPKTTNSPSAPATHSHLFALPAEIRNRIYEYVTAYAGPAYLIPRSKGRLIANIPLLQVNHQLREEATAMLYLYVHSIDATVKDLDFGHIVKFFNRLKDYEMARLVSTDDLDADGLYKSYDKTCMYIHIELTDNTQYFVDRLQRWFHRYTLPGKKGTAVEIGYYVQGSWEQRKQLRHILAVMRQQSSDERQQEWITVMQKNIPR